MITYTYGKIDNAEYFVKPLQWDIGTTTISL